MKLSMLILYMRKLLPTKKMMGIVKNKRLIKLLEYVTYLYEEEYKIFYQNWNVLFLGMINVKEWKTLLI